MMNFDKVEHKHLQFLANIIIQHEKGIDAIADEIAYDEFTGRLKISIKPEVVTMFATQFPNESLDILDEAFVVLMMESVKQSGK